VKCSFHLKGSSQNKCIYDHIGGVMVTVFDSSAVYGGFPRRSGLTKDWQIGIFAASHLRSESE